MGKKNTKNSMDYNDTWLISVFTFMLRILCYKFTAVAQSLEMYFNLSSCKENHPK